MTTGRRPADFAAGHAAGLWSASAAEWRVLVREVLEQEVAGLPITVLGLTECTRVTPWKPGGWNIFHDAPDSADGRDECAIMWDTLTWSSAGPGWTEPLTDHTFTLPAGERRPRVHATIKPLRLDRLGRVVVFIELHSPSGVDAGNRLESNARAAVTRDVLRGRRRLKRRIRRMYPGAQIIEHADENVDLRREWARRLTSTAGGILVWVADQLPGRGTHGPRLIDSARHSYGLAVVAARVLRRIAPFDHNPIAAAYRFRRQPRRSTP